MIPSVLQVAIGGACGAVLRYGTGLAVMRLTGPFFPAGTFFVNVVGSFVMGVFAVMLVHKGFNHYAPLLMTGLLGGFTTFSAFSLDALGLIERGHYGAACVYILGSVGLSLLAILAGLSLARSIWA